MSSEISLVFVPLWLSRIMRELGVRYEDLTDIEKLSNILSTRDILIYGLANSRIDEILTKFTLGPVPYGTQRFGLTNAIPEPDKTAALILEDTPVEVLMFGSTVGAQQVRYNYRVKCLNESTIVLEMYETSKTGPFTRPIQKLANAVFNMVGLECFVTMPLSKFWIDAGEVARTKVSYVQE